jgi:hypothetical protein
LVNWTANFNSALADEFMDRLEVVLRLAAHADLVVHDLGLHFEFCVLDHLDDEPGVLLVDPHAKPDHLADGPTGGGFRRAVIERLQGDTPLDHLVLEYVDDGLELEVVVGDDGDLLFLQVELDRALGSLEIVPLGDFLARLVDGVVRLLEVDLRDDVE